MDMRQQDPFACCGASHEDCEGIAAMQAHVQAALSTSQQTFTHFRIKFENTVSVMALMASMRLSGSESWVT